MCNTHLLHPGDKVFVASLATALAAKGAVPAWLAACILGRDAALVVGAGYQRARQENLHIHTH